MGWNYYKSSSRLYFSTNSSINSSVGSLLILLGICVIGSKYVYNYFLDKEENSKIKEFYEEQEKIATILNIIDDKIEVNNAINHNLAA